MAVAVVVLLPDVAGEQIIQGSDRLPPGHFARQLGPLGILGDHGVDDRDERLVAGEDPVSACQQIAFEPTLAAVLTENLHNPAVRGEIFVGGSERPFEGS